MALDGFCQNGKCKNKASVRVSSGIEVVLEEKDGIPTKIGQRQLDLCPEDADYFLSVRDEKGSTKKVEKFIKSCHQD